MKHFTKEQIEEIRIQLATKAVRDSDFDVADSLADEDLIPILQDGINKTAPAQLVKDNVINEIRQGVDGKVLSSNDYTDTEKEKLAGIAEGAQVNAPYTVIDPLYVHTDNNYTTPEKTKLRDIAPNAQVNVIEAVKVNGTELPAIDKKVNVDLSDYVKKDIVPTEATPENPLADKDFVNSSISTATADFRGTSAQNLSEAQFLAWAYALPEYNKNDYVYWDTVDVAGTPQFRRYKYTGAEWAYEYTLNNSSFTASEWASIRSGITSDLTQKIAAMPTVSEMEAVIQQAADAASYANTKGAYADEKGTAANTAASLANAAANRANAAAANCEADHTIAQADHVQAGLDHASLQELEASVTEAEEDRQAQESERVENEDDRVAADAARGTRADSDHTRAEQDHTRAESDHSTASSDHTRAESDHAIAAEDHATLDEKIAHKADIDGYYEQMGVRIAKNLESWEGESLMAEDPQSLAVFTTGGDMSIDSSVPAQLVEVAAKTDFSATSLLASGFNLLRLTSANGPAKAVGAGYYFPVPALPFGSINTAEQPNGVLFTSRTGENLRPTVYFKKLSQGVPTSVTDGTACSYTDAVSGDKSYRFYNPTEPGYIIVSGITWADTCAHIGWSKRYDEFIAPDDASDAGHAIALTAAIAAAHSFGKLLTVGASADRIRRISATQVQWETEVDRVQPAWTNTLQEDGETYLHTATIAAMKADGAAQFMTVSRQLAISGTTISYTDTSATAYTDFVKYEKAARSTGTVNLATALAVEDWGLIILLDAVGEAFTTIAYAQNIPDNVRALVSARLSGQMEIVAQAFAELYSWAEDITRRLFGAQDHPIYRATEVDAQIYRIGNIPMEVHGAGAPSAAVIPVDWDKLCPGVTWRGVPLAPGMVYTDDTNSKVYKAKAVLTNAVSDWILLN